MGSSELKKFRPEATGAAEGTVLEIGVGPGYNIPLYRNIRKLYALEPSQELLEVAQTHVTQNSFPVEFLHAGAEHIPLPDNSIDTVVSTWTLCSIEHPNAALKEIARVLKPGGKFIFIEHGASPRAPARLLQKILTPFTKHFTGNCHMDRNIEKLITDAGYTISITKKFPQNLFSPLIYNTQGVALPHRTDTPGA